MEKKQKILAWINRSDCSVAKIVRKVGEEYINDKEKTDTDRVANPTEPIRQGESDS